MNGKVLVGMSGGVDSSTAAAILQEQGYDIIGVTLNLYDYMRLGFEPPDGACCSVEMIDDARSVCAKLGVPHYVIDLKQAFNELVINNFVESYSRGRTPNPCINCNSFIKWGEMLRTADKIGCDYIATGHYARIEGEGDRIRLLRGRDRDKDQSYALWGIKPDALRRTMLPIGELSKSEVRAKAAQLGFRNAQRPDSQEICFVPTGDYAHIIRQQRGSDDPSLTPGPIYDTAGRQIGEHKGFAYYTIGQRRGFGISSKEPLYVTRIDPQTRGITVGEREELFSRCFVVTDINLLAASDEIPEDVIVKVRYRHDGALAKLRFTDTGAEIEFHRPERAITPGQSAVFYHQDQVLGGGIIDRIDR